MKGGENEEEYNDKQNEKESEKNSFKDEDIQESKDVMFMSNYSQSLKR